MLFKQIQDRVMFQTNNDEEDLNDYLPHLSGYINQGYDELVYAHTGEHVSSESKLYPTLMNDTDEPNLPEYAHAALADYGTYMLYRNGNATKQNRASAFYGMYANTLSKLKYERSKNKKFINIYTE